MGYITTISEMLEANREVLPQVYLLAEDRNLYCFKHLYDDDNGAVKAVTLSSAMTTRDAYCWLVGYLANIGPHFRYRSG